MRCYQLELFYLPWMLLDSHNPTMTLLWRPFGYRCKFKFKLKKVLFKEKLCYLGRIVTELMVSLSVSLSKIIK